MLAERARAGVIGYKENEQLDVEPAKYFVRVIKREKRACRKCEEQGVVTVPVPRRIIEKGLTSDEIVIDTVAVSFIPTREAIDRPTSDD